MSNETGGPAFPRPYSEDKFNEETCLAQAGMTLRDYFAAKAISGLFSPGVWPSMPSMETAVRCAYLVADLMLAERARGES